MVANFKDVQKATAGGATKSASVPGTYRAFLYLGDV